MSEHGNEWPFSQIADLKAEIERLQGEIYNMQIAGKAEVARLRAELDNGDETLGRYIMENDKLGAEIERLRAEFDLWHASDSKELTPREKRLRAALEEIVAHPSLSILNPVYCLARKALKEGK